MLASNFSGHPCRAHADLVPFSRRSLASAGRRDLRVAEQGVDRGGIKATDSERRERVAEVVEWQRRQPGGIARGAVPAM